MSSKPDGVQMPGASADTVIATNEMTIDGQTMHLMASLLCVRCRVRGRDVPALFVYSGQSVCEEHFTEEINGP